MSDNIVDFMTEVGKIQVRKADKQLASIYDTALREAMRGVMLCDDADKGRETAKALLRVADILDEHATRLGVVKLAEISLETRMVAGYQLSHGALAVVRDCLNEYAALAQDPAGPVTPEQRQRLHEAQTLVAEALACELVPHPLLVKPKGER